MKFLNKLSRVLKVTGIVLVCVAAVLWLYSLANTGGTFNTLSARLAEAGESTNLADRLRFDNRYFTALSQAASSVGQETLARAEALRPQFTPWFARLEAAESAENDRIFEEALTWLKTDFDREAFLLRLDAIEEMQESQELREIFEYLNSLSTVPKKGKVAGLQAASQEPWFQEYYESFSAEHGEAAGTWYEFMTTVRAMMEEASSAGETIRDAKTWMTENFSFDTYTEKLPQVQARERAAGDNFAEKLGELLTREKAGENADYAALLREAAAEVTARYAEQNLTGSLSAEAALGKVLPALLLDEAFDGSYAAIAEALRAAAAENAESSLAAWESSFCAGIVTTADARAAIGAVSIFWAVVGWYAAMLLLGILLILVACGMKKMISRRMMASLKEDAGVREDSDVLLRVEHLKQYFKSGNSVTKAVDDVSFFIRRGEVFGLVGESGCGKTTTGRTIINLYDPTDGDVWFDGLRISSTQNGLPVLKAQLRQDYQARIAAARKQGDGAEAARLKAELREKLRQAEDHALESAVEKSKCVELYRQRRLRELKEAYDAEMTSLSGEAAAERTRRYETERKAAAKDNVMTRMQMIFQDPIASINPRMTVREIIAEGLIVHGITDREYINRRVDEMLELVGLVREHADRYPHEFSGGQRQRIGIARAIIMEPDLIIADEPISALDVSIQAQVINLLNDLRERMGLTIMFIAHNLSVVKYFSDRIGVMCFGRMVELADSDELFAHPLHPYTKSLLSAIPYPDPNYEKKRRRIEYVPDRDHDYSRQQPTLREIIPGHWILCNDEELVKYRKEMGLA